MNERQRCVASLTFGQPYQISFEPGGPRESTLNRWRQKGLPAEVNDLDHLRDLLGLERPRTAGKPQGFFPLASGVSRNRLGP